MPTFVVQARHSPESLVRIVLLFHRRRIEIRSLVARVERSSGVLWIEAEVRAEEGRVRHLEANLYNLVEVLFVEQRKNENTIVRRSKGLDFVCESGE
jgi:acetolactate synthase I/III small subunit